MSFLNMFFKKRPVLKKENEWKDIAEKIAEVLARNWFDAPRLGESGRTANQKVLDALLALEAKVQIAKVKTGEVTK